MPITPIASTAATVILDDNFTEWRVPLGTSLTGVPGIRISESNISLFIDGDISSTDDTIRIESPAEDAFIFISASATITARGSNVADGIETFLGAEFVTVINDGIIDAEDNGVELVNFSNLVNNGTINGDNAAFSVGGSGTSLVNNGLMTGGAGVNLFGALGGNILHNNGVIRGTNEGIFVAVNTTSPITLINTGNISATNGPRAFDGQAGTENIFNSGTMFGNISFGGGADFYSARGGDGRVTGTIFGENGNDRLIGGDLDDIINGGANDDIIIGGTGDDLLIGAGDRDFLNGEQGDDIIRGGGGDDTMLGGQGADTLTGFGGDDLMDGGQGNDALNAGVGADTFRFQLLAGNDRIFGWEDGTDQIDLTAYGITNFGAVNGAISASGGNAVIDLGMLGGVGSITVNGAAGDLDAGDFLL